MNRCAFAAAVLTAFGVVLLAQDVTPTSKPAASQPVLPSVPDSDAVVKAMKELAPLVKDKTPAELLKLATETKDPTMKYLLLKKGAAGKGFAGNLDQAVRTLSTLPEDPNANQTVGSFYAFYVGDWKTGLVYLTRSSDDDIKHAALLELNDPQQVDDIGEAWLKVAAKQGAAAQKQIKSHVLLLWESALESVTGAEKEILKNKIARLLKDIYGPAGQILGKWNMSTADGRYRSVWTFLPDGTVKSTNGVRLGRWTLKNSSVLIWWTEDGKQWNTIEFPGSVTTEAPGKDWIGNKPIRVSRVE